MNIDAFARMRPAALTAAVTDGTLESLIIGTG
jgi:hypothetical protein